MKTWMSFWIVGFALAAGMASAAEGDFMHGRLFPPDVITQHRQALQLTDQQSASIRDIIRGSQSEVMALRWDMMSAMDTVSARLDSASVDEAAVIGELETLLKLENAVKLEQVKMLIRIRNVLTEEQVSYLRSVASDGRGGSI